MRGMVGSPTQPRLHIIVSCTDRKRLQVPEALRLGGLRGLPPELRFPAWWSALQADTSQQLPAEELYIGAHWSVARKLPGAARAAGFDARLWVVSAGYGLVPSTARLHAYSATFSRGEADSVVARGEATGEAPQRWWQALTRIQGPDPSAPRSLAALARASPGARLMLVCSAHYLWALEADLLEALDTMGDPDRLLLISGEPGPGPEAIRRCWIPSSAAFQQLLGGARTSLHVRLALRLLEDAPTRGLDSSALRAWYRALAAELPPAPWPRRRQATDARVRSFIARALRRKPGLGHTPLLRAFRARGNACEQSRFKRLFFTMKNLKA